MTTIKKNQKKNVQKITKPTGQVTITQCIGVQQPTHRVIRHATKQIVQILGKGDKDFFKVKKKREKRK